MVWLAGASRFAPYLRLVPVSWALTDPAGRFAGVIAVAASWQPYATFFASLTNGPEQTVALIDGCRQALCARRAPLAESGGGAAAAAVPGGYRQPSGLPEAAGMVGGYLVDRADVPGLGLQVVTGSPLTTILQAMVAARLFVTGLVVMIGLATAP